MTDAAERLINLALFLASSRGFVTAEQVRAEVDGYPASQDESAFLRMFERDKDELRSAGLDIVSDAEGRYRLDAEGTFASSVPLTATETASLRLVAAAFADDPTFPFADDLRLALVKLATDADTPDAATIASLAEDVVVDQGEHVAQLDAAASAGKRVEFDYVNAQGEHKHHKVEPYGQFVRDGLWYLVARDTDLAEIRVYSVARISALEVNAARPKSPDFSVPEDFEIAHFIGLPFQYGAEEGTAVVRFAPSAAWKALAFANVSGSTEEDADGSVRWTVRYRNGRAVRAWVVANGPGLTIVEPESLAGELALELQTVARAHA